MPNLMNMINQEDLHSAMLHASGRGAISPVPSSGAGLWSSIKGFAKQAYKFASPIVAKAGRQVARDVITGLNRDFGGEGRKIEL
jgi:hypothetical protein